MADMPTFAVFFPVHVRKKKIITKRMFKTSMSLSPPPPPPSGAATQQLTTLGVG